MSQPSAEFLQNAIFLIDASSYIFRAYYAIQAELRAPDGTPTHATYGFISMIQSLEKEYPKAPVVLIWDRPEKGYRHELYKEYKANRSAPPEDLGVQIQNVKEGTRLLGYPTWELSGYEADDILATLVRRFPNQAFAIVTADKDLLQLVGENVWCLDTFRKKWSNFDEAKEKFGVPPALIRDVQSLCGDSVDNIPGAPGIGPKGSAELISHFGSLENVLKTAQERFAARAEAPKGDPLKGKKLESIANNIPLIEISKKLVTLHDNVPIEVVPQDFVRRAFLKEEFKAWAKHLGFNKFVAMADSPQEMGTVHNRPMEVTEAPRSLPQRQLGDFHGISSLSELRDTLQAAAHQSRMALDTETLSLESRQEGNLVGVSFSFGEGKGFYIPLRHVAAKNLDVKEVLEVLAKFLSSRPSGFKVVFQNAKFDLHVLCAEGYRLPEGIVIEDTMVQSFVCDPTQAHGMDALSKKFLDYEPVAFSSLVAKGSNFSEVSVEDAIRYSAEDALVTFELYSKLRAELDSTQTQKVYEEIDAPLVNVLFEMEENGVGLDLKRLKVLSWELQEELRDKERQARELLKASGLNPSPDLNLGSPKQVAEILFEALKLPIIKKGKTGPSTDMGVLEELSHLHPFPSALVEIRELSKLLSTYVDAFPLLVDPKSLRLHTDFSQTIAATGRLSSSRPNLQNIPIRTERGRKIRESFIAQPGFKLLSIDYSQIELRLLAHVSQDEELIKAFREDADIHKRTAALMLGKKESEVNDEDRRTAKTINFGIIYGQSAFGLSKTLGIPKHQAQNFIDQYFKTYSRIRNYMDDTIAEAKKFLEVRTLTGRRRPLRDIQSKNPTLRQLSERMAINSPLQGLAADLMKKAMVDVFVAMKKEKFQGRLVLQVHDELLFEVPDEEGERLQKFAVEIMEDRKLLKNLGVPEFRVPLKVNASLGQNWGEL